MDKTGVSKSTRPSRPIASQYISVIASVLAVIFSSCLQFLQHGPILLGRSDQAVSGATILSISLVFTGLMFVSSYHYVQRVREYQLALDEADAVADLIEQGDRAATLFKLKRNLLRGPNV